MAKYHVTKNGTPGVCKAHKGNCPLGGEGEHFDTPEAAQEYADKRNSQLISEKDLNAMIIKENQLDAKDIITVSSDNGEEDRNHFVSNGIEDKLIKEMNEEGYFVNEIDYDDSGVTVSYSDINDNEGSFELYKFDGEWGTEDPGFEGLKTIETLNEPSNGIMSKTFDSSFMESGNYDPDTKRLTLSMSGKTYNFDNVPKNVATGLMNADSAGKYFIKNIKGREEYAEVKNPKINKTFENSSFMQTAEYDPETKRLTLSMNNKTYNYDNVPQDVAQGLVDAESAGKYFSQNIKGKEEYAEVNSSQINKTFDGSSFMQSAKYDPTTQRLILGMNNKTYNYDNVPPKVAQGLVDAESAGEYFIKNIRDKEEYSEVEQSQTTVNKLKTTSTPAPSNSANIKQTLSKILENKVRGVYLGDSRDLYYNPGAPNTYTNKGLQEFYGNNKIFYRADAYTQKAIMSRTRRLQNTAEKIGHEIKNIDVDYELDERNQTRKGRVMAELDNGVVIQTNEFDYFLY